MRYPPHAREVLGAPAARSAENERIPAELGELPTQENDGFFRAANAVEEAVGIPRADAGAAVKGDRLAPAERGPTRLLILATSNHPGHFRTAAAEVQWHPAEGPLPHRTPWTIPDDEPARADRYLHHAGTGSRW